MARKAALDRRQLLAGNRLFRHLGEGELDELVTYAKVQRYRQNQTIYHKGDTGISLMAVLSGRVKISSVSADGKEAILNIIDAGTVFGEISFLDGKDRSADVTAMQDTELMVLDRRDFIPFLEKHPQITVGLIEVLCERLRRTNEMLEDSAFLTLPTRLAKRLVWLMDEYGQETESGTRIELKLSQRELGGLVGLSRENINRQLRAWHKEGLIALDGGYITVLDVDTVEDIADYLAL
jgi:CRP-like cAMP-binding protein